MNRSASIRCLIASTLCIALALPPAAQASAQPDASPSAATAGPVFAGDGMIQIDVVDPFARRHAAKPLAARAEQVLTDLGITPPGDPQGPWSIRIEVNGHQRNFSVTVAGTRGGEAFGAGTPTACECTYDQLPAFVDDGLRTLIAELQAAQAPPLEPAPSLLPGPLPTAPTKTSATFQSEDTAVPLRRTQSVGGLGIAGIVAIAVGIAGTAAGATYVAKDTQVEGTGQTHVATDYRTPGTEALLGAGIAVLVGGIAMLVVDLTVCKNRLRGCKKPPRTASTLSFTF